MRASAMFFFRIGLRVPLQAQPGFHEVRQDGRAWRVYSVRDAEGKVVVQVACSRDEQGKVLAPSRDLDVLRAKFGGRAGDAFAARAGREMAADGLRTFPASPIPLQVPGEAGVPDGQGAFPV